MQKLLCAALFLIFRLGGSRTVGRERCQGSKEPPKELKYQPLARIFPRLTLN